jgi:hypothetical protein
MPCDADAIKSPRKGCPRPFHVQIRVVWSSLEAPASPLGSRLSARKVNFLGQLSGPSQDHYLAIRPDFYHAPRAGHQKLATIGSRASAQLADAQLSYHGGVAR